MEKTMRHFYDQDYYQKHGFEWDVDIPFFLVIARTLVEKFRPRSVLDIGCGIGYLVHCFNELGVEAYGVDVSEYATGQSPESVRAALFNVDCEFEKLPFEAETVDMVTATELLEHLQNHNHLISEIKRILRPGGTVFITTPKKHWDIFMRIIMGGEPTHVNVQSKSYWIRTFESHGFHYISDVPAWKDALYAKKHAMRKVIGTRPPTSKIARLLVKFGKGGKCLRAELACLLVLVPRTALLFKS